MILLPAYEKPDNLLIMKKKFDFKRYIFHAIAVILVITYEITFTKALGNTYRFWDWVVVYAIDISLLFFNALFVLPLSQKGISNRLIMVLIILLELLAHSILYVNGNELTNLIYSHQKPYEFGKYDFIRNLGRGVLILGASIFYYIGQISIANAKRAREAENQRLKMENDFLRTQINPHFLFNTLNMIISSVSYSSERAGEMILLLSEMMQDTLAEVDERGMIPLSVEIKQIKRLLHLNKLRLQDKMYVTLRIQVDDPDSISVPPLLLITFIENIFKYGKVSNPENPALININRNGPELDFKLSNLKKTNHAFEGLSMGISNAKARLNNFYGNRYNLMINENETNFKLQLKIKL